MKTDIEIAQQAKIEPIDNIAHKVGIEAKDYAPYGRHIAKVDYRLADKLADKPDGKVILVTAINPTPAGEGKSTTCIGLADALQQLNKKPVLALREPSLGPVFGMKGGATGGGYAQVVPMENINLHFTGDIHAITAANNLLAAMIDNHIFQGNDLQIDTRRIMWRRCLDVNDRQLRSVTDGLGGVFSGVPREDGFDISVASEIMAIFCLASDITDLKKRLSHIVIAYTFNQEPVTAGDIGAAGALTALLRDAFDPNLVQTLEGTPALVHGGPFANIAHGCNSVIATRLARKLGDYTITEAGFGSDLGAEKFLDIKCRFSGIRPSAVVMVATIRALKYNGGVKKDDLNTPNLEALKKGAPNLAQHIKNIQEIYHLPVVVAINHFPTDTEEETRYVQDLCASIQVPCAISTVFEEGGKGGLDLAEAVLNAAEQPSTLEFAYPDTASLEEKIQTICQKVYHADKAIITSKATKKLNQYTKLGYDKLPVCIAKTQYSFSDNPTLFGAPKQFNITINDVRLSAGAGFVVAIAGNIMTMPGLPKKPAALGIDVNKDGLISGLF